MGVVERRDQPVLERCMKRTEQRRLTMAEQVVATPAAVKLIHELRQQHGPLMFHQSGGCCDGSVPLCFRLGEFRVGSRDVLLGTVEETPFYVGHAQAEYLQRTQLVLDAIPGDIDSFSLEAGSGVRFLSRSNACMVETPRVHEGEAIASDL